MSTPHAHLHDHAHDHAHGHALASGGRSRKLLFAFVLTAVMMMVEVVGGAWSGSLALLADAGHMMVDALALLLAVVGAWVATRPADARRSYGYGRMEVLAGFVNAMGQFVLVGWIVYEAVVRLLHPGEILSGMMLAVAVAGLLVNALVLRTLHGHAHDDVNLAGASLHVLGDLLGSLAAVLAALAIRWLGWLWADPVLSLLVSLLILGSAWRLLRMSAHILLEGVPDGMDSALVEASLRTADPAIRDIHHLHVWQLASGSRMATVHAELDEHADGARALQAIKRMLLERFGIQHVTVQIDPGKCLDAGGDCAGHGQP
ncbi:MULTISPECIES: cation diffusion facilitator family transporter [unclassified Rhodanobacter]|uniref:cation diffusion facilitator family transporter n=1 Tax=unclassified Rhodanobacter TaxID=2621553 RepID=UPI001BDF49AE|nr:MULTISPECIES: cation diffusion facilitator family transporter [unclassified Rhodanobacter]MBT2142842.1 cation diffusion facilitator family transporter [Rhodanobacter sp. LX-99]MBT2148085.1 cation diffusion facilitator family transporter [Rhodanobacter sp. LX-100]